MKETDGDLYVIHHDRIFKCIREAGTDGSFKENSVTLYSEVPFDEKGNHRLTVSRHEYPVKIFPTERAAKEYLKVRACVKEHEKKIREGLDR
jgi:hypothetical protein